MTEKMDSNDDKCDEISLGSLFECMFHEITSAMKGKGEQKPNPKTKAQNRFRLFDSRGDQRRRHGAEQKQKAKPQKMKNFSRKTIFVLLVMGVQFFFLLLEWGYYIFPCPFCTKNIVFYETHTQSSCIRCFALNLRSLPSKMCGTSAKKGIFIVSGHGWNKRATAFCSLFDPFMDLFLFSLRLPCFNFGPSSSIIFG